MDLARDGKAAGERMNRFFKDRNVKLMPSASLTGPTQRRPSAAMAAAHFGVRGH